MCSWNLLQSSQVIPYHAASNNKIKPALQDSRNANFLFDFNISRGTDAYLLPYVQSLEKYSYLADKIKTEKRGEILLMAKNISH